MNKNDKDKIRLLILGIIIIGFGYYKYVYSAQVTAIDEKIKQESIVIEKYNNAMNTINSFEDRKTEVKILKAKINDKSKPFYPIISEEQIIVEIDKLLKDSNLKGGITFQPIVSDNVEVSKDEMKSLQDSSVKKIVDQYNNISMNNVNTEVNKSTNENDFKSDGHNKENNTMTSDANNANAQKNSKEKKNTVQFVKCEVRVEGSFEGINKLLTAIDNNERKIIVNSIKISEDTYASIKGTINLEFYSIPKINNEVESYLKWNLNNDYGKNLLFSNVSASGNLEENKVNSDFTASIKAISSEMPTVIIGKTNDFLRSTYVYADSNSEENVEFILTQDNGKYYYRYKTSRGMYPTDSNGVGAVFVPVSKNIIINVLSEYRIGSNDKSELKLKITNKTDKLINVNITGDDKKDPRVKVEGNGSSISVNQK